MQPLTNPVSRSWMRIQLLESDNASRHNVCYSLLQHTTSANTRSAGTGWGQGGRLCFAFAGFSAVILFQLNSCNNAGRCEWTDEGMEATSE